MPVLTVSDPGAAAGLAGLWRRAAGPSPPPMQQLEWLLACIATVDAGARLAVRAADTDDGAAVVPLVRRAGSPRLELAGVRLLAEPTDFVASSPAALGALAEALARDRVPLRLARLPARSATTAALRDAFGAGAVRVVPATGTPVLRLDGAEPERVLSSSLRADLRRAQRRADALGTVRHELLAPAPEEVAPLLATAVAVEAHGWKGRAGTALAADPVRRAFFERYAVAAAARGELRVAFLRIGDVVAAMQLAVQADGRLWVLKVGYDERFARASPGQLLLLGTLRAAAAAGLRSYELLGCPAPWTARWTREERPCVDLRAYPRTLRTVPAVAGDAAAAAWQRRHGPATRARGAVAARAARGHVAGPQLADALAAARRLRERGLACAAGFWDAGTEAPEEVARRSGEAAAALAAEDLDGYVALKATALRFDAALLGGVLEAAGRAPHLDAMAPDTAERTLALAAALGPGRVGVTLPGRWARSPRDAARAAELGARVRVVKGQWPDLERPADDGTDGVLRTVEALAGRARLVAVATHDVGLLGRCLDLLAAAGTPAEVELMLGLPQRAATAAARRRGVPVRVYVPFGHPWLPYGLDRVRRDGRVALWLARDLAPGRRG